MINAPEKLSLARLSTPLQRLQRFSDQLGGPTIWVKRDDLTGCIETGNKIRKLEFVFAKAIQSGCDTVITAGGTQSNHCRATAAVAARLGMKCHLILREDHSSELSTGNLLLDQFFGASIQVFPKERFSSKLNGRFESLTNQLVDGGNNPYSIPVGASDGVGLWGYIEAAKEIADDCKALAIEPEAIICATGSGGTQGGLTLGTQLYDFDTDVIGIAVCDDAAYFDRKVKEDWADWQRHYPSDVTPDTSRIQTLEDYIGPAYGVAEAPVYQLIKSLAETEGLLLDPTYTGKAFYGLVEEIKKGRFQKGQHVVFVHTGGVYGLLAQPENLSAYIDPIDTLRQIT